MSLNLSVNLEAYPKDEEVGIEGIGRVENGGSIEITPEMEESYFYRTGKTVNDTFVDQGGLTITGSPTFTAPEDFKISDTSVNVVEADPTENDGSSDEVLLVEDTKPPAIVEIPTGLPKDGDN